MRAPSGPKFPKPLQNHPCVASARQRFIANQRRAEAAYANGTGVHSGICSRRRPTGGNEGVAGASGDGAGGTGGGKEGGGGGAEGGEGHPAKRADLEDRRCSQSVALQGLAPAAQEDWIGLERHWDGWVRAACNGKLRASDGAPVRIIFARNSRLSAHASELAAQLGLPSGCMPESMCSAWPQPPFPDADGSEQSRAALAALNQTFRSLRAKQAAVGDFLLLDTGRPTDTGLSTGLSTGLGTGRPGHAPDNDIGPMVSTAHRDRVTRMCAPYRRRRF